MIRDLMKSVLKMFPHGSAILVMTTQVAGLCGAEIQPTPCAITRDNVRLIAGFAESDVASMVTHVSVERLDLRNNGVFSAGIAGQSGSYATR